MILQIYDSNRLRKVMSASVFFRWVEVQTGSPAAPAETHFKYTACVYFNM